METYPVEPMGKPRMTRADRITMAKIKARKRMNKREMKRVRLLSRWMAYQDECRIRHIKLDLDHYYHLIFVLPMPASWSMAQREAAMYTPHQAKPDKDNLEKGLLDTLYGEDMAAWNGQVTKVWGQAGGIIVSKSQIDVSARSLFVLVEGA